MPMHLTEQLRENLSWLASNWEEKQLQHISSFNQEFYKALLAVLNGNASRTAIELVIEGTHGKVADGYAHLLVVEPARAAKDPFITLRILGDISTELAKLENSC